MFCAGHSLEEIRVRALHSLLGKLERDLVVDADLVQETSLHVRLLEWFNFTSCPLQAQTLALVLRLVKVTPMSLAHAFSHVIALSDTKNYSTFKLFYS